ncbi:TlpA disulfide reductase family protein [Mesorhizobium sp. M0771]|uniref:TlpA disulfide reductase family protein n=1 Tax=Mesorhizobium sp. M0771 TaxID=2956997 RepID=UPI00333C1C92
MGSPAPSIKVEDWLRDGLLADFQPGKVYIVEFWATWCELCAAEMLELKQLQEKYQDSGLEVVGIAADEDAPTGVEARTKLDVWSKSSICRICCRPSPSTGVRRLVAALSLRLRKTISRRCQSAVGRGGKIKNGNWSKWHWPICPFPWRDRGKEGPCSTSSIVCSRIELKSSWLRSHCGGSDVQREFAWKTSQSWTCSRSARSTSIAGNRPPRAGRRLRKCPEVRVQKQRRAISSEVPIRTCSGRSTCFTPPRSLPSRSAPA